MEACLEAGARYMWFIREVSPVGEPLAPWSPGLAFQVSQNGGGAPGDHGQAADGTSRTSQESPTLRERVSTAVQPPNTPPDSIQVKLDAMNAKLDALLDPVSRQICLELGAELEAHIQYGGSIDGEFEGRIGAEGFGNGVMGKVKAKPGFDFGANLKGAAVPKVAFCRAFGPIFQNSLSPAQARMTSALAGPDALGDEELTNRLLALAEKLNLTEGRMAAAMDAIPAFSSNGDLWQSLRSGGALSAAAEALPLPEGLRTTLQDPGQIVANFRAQLALCQQSDLPPAIAGVVSEFCGLAQNERFSRLLDRVDGAVTSVRNVVDDILGQLPTSGNCKFFCGSSNE
jgi:hypothetical protein